ncbi:baseplate assembly protein [Acinetobacter rathckeae]|uniref:baseplate assembly protein n=1 Tax=Acinetobacter rathckeae TaxID=2605272 RepID=UPI0018A32BA7|nr:baseplate J/gp47 family protein [Acinetobacter rathckeae]MBF7687740.1 baseplate J/gp47 family protein [Acinetobacter rathckeae]MBF7688037.1 baseplate J/gp47 family protein [Acinetobacter rathckeae]
MNVIFSQLTPPQMIEVIDFETLLQERKEQLIAKWSSISDQDYVRDMLNRDSEPLTKYLQENVYRELLLRNRINTASQAVLLAYATGTDLDAVAANFDVKRLTVAAATSTSAAVYESDEDLRTRTQMKFDSLSTAGPENAYKYHAFSADGRVADVSVTSPNPAYVNITILQKDADKNIASTELIQKVANALAPESVRPIGDRITVKTAEIIEYSIDASIYIGKDPEGATLLEQAKSNILAYTTKQKRLGRSIYLSEIYAQLHVTGVSHVVLNTPKNDTILTTEQASFCTNINLTLAGVE